MMASSDSWKSAELEARFALLMGPNGRPLRVTDVTSVLLNAVYCSSTWKRSLLVSDNGKVLPSKLKSMSEKNTVGPTVAEMPFTGSSGKKSNSITSWMAKGNTPRKNEE